MKVAVVYNEPVTGRKDSEDVLSEVELVTQSLRELGHDFKVFPVGDRNGAFSISESVFYLLLSLRKCHPNVVFNLFEGYLDNPVYQHYLSLMLELLDYPFTGSGQEAILTTTDKGLSKRIMKAFNITTAQYQEYRGKRISLEFDPPWIVKPALEDGSNGIDDTSIFHDEPSLQDYLPRMYQRYGRQPIIIEQFIEGREFNISLLETKTGEVNVLPVAEIVFQDWPEGKPRIVGYEAKWASESFEYNNTVRKFLQDDALEVLLADMAKRCWRVFTLGGYARIDVRVDGSGRMYVIDVNANPCIAPDAGFIAAAKAAGYEVRDIVGEIVGSALRDLRYGRVQTLYQR